MLYRIPQVVTAENFISGNLIFLDTIKAMIEKAGDRNLTLHLKKIEYVALGFALVVKLSYIKDTKKNPVFLVKKVLDNGVSYGVYKDAHSFLDAINASVISDSLTDKELYFYKKLDLKEKIKASQI